MNHFVMTSAIMKRDVILDYSFFVIEGSILAWRMCMYIARINHNFPLMIAYVNDIEREPRDAKSWGFYVLHVMRLLNLFYDIYSSVTWLIVHHVVAAIHRDGYNMCVCMAKNNDRFFSSKSRKGKKEFFGAKGFCTTFMTISQSRNQKSNWSFALKEKRATIKRSCDYYVAIAIFLSFPPPPQPNSLQGASQRSSSCLN